MCCQAAITIRDFGSYFPTVEHRHPSKSTKLVDCFVTNAVLNDRRITEKNDIYLFLITSYTKYMTHYTNTQLRQKSTADFRTIGVDMINFF